MSWRLAIGFLISAPFLGGLLEGVDRVLCARMQGRQGPPLLQPFYDMFKLINKQSVVVNNVQDILVCGFLIFVVFAGLLFYWGGDILLAVSYTHLDVYKRQGGPIALLEEDDLIELDISNRTLQIVGVKNQRMEAEACLLYTSRCV